ncbi:MAG: UDP-N-acetylmuramate dehydrogenase [Ruminococcaceae bacterium]|nr:UDP-N-acetylmuramate dehydrogenase [Oscillospiraceae bacterium]
MAIYGLGSIEIRENESLSRHSSFRIGGDAKYAFFPKDKSELECSVKYCIDNGLNFKIIGNASNVLFDDRGFDGAIIFTTRINSLEYIRRADSTLVKVGCGRSLTDLAYETGKKQSLTGLEFAYGIPGTVGGAIYMNAGAYGGQMSDVVFETEYLDLNDMSVKKLCANEHMYTYRNSVFIEHPEYVILNTTLKLSFANAEDIFAAMNRNMAARREKQPLEYPNAGSIFKRPGDNIFAGKLIQDANLKGYAIGGAQISEKHAGFIINRGNATSKDVLDLIEHTKKTVFSMFGISLECEVIYIPYN